MSDEITPCPFCGGTDLSDEKTEAGWPVVQCDSCGAQGPCIEIVKTKARAAWNNRSVTVELPEAQKPL